MTYKCIFDTIQLFCLWIWKENSKYFWKEWKEVMRLLPKTKTFWFNSFFFHVKSIIDFKFAIPSSFYINNDANNNIIPSILKRSSKFFNEIHPQKHETQITFKSNDWWHHGLQLNYDDNMHVTFLKSIFELWFI
jgi:hypothetical protein